MGVFDRIFLGLPGQKVFLISFRLMQRILKLTAQQQPACCSLGKFVTQIQELRRQKGGCSLSYRANKRRLKLKTSCGL